MAARAKDCDSQISPLYVYPLDPNWESPFSSVHKTTFATFFGAVSAFKSDFLAIGDFCAQHSTFSPKSLQNAISGFISLTHSDCLGTVEQKKSCYVTVWLWKAQPDGFGTPAWHRDGPLYPMRVGQMPFPRSKYAITLLGQPTRVLVNTPQVIEVANKAYDGTDGDPPYDKMVELFDAAGFGTAACEDVQTGQVVRFTWGEANSPVHAEPIITADRVFMSVVYGTEEEIKALAEWQEGKYLGEDESGAP